MTSLQNQASFWKRLDPKGKLALQKLIKANEILALDPVDGPRIVNEAADELGAQGRKRRARMLEEGTVKNRGAGLKMIPFSVERRMATSAAPGKALVQKFDTQKASTADDATTVLDVEQLHAARMAEIAELDELIRKAGEIERHPGNISAEDSGTKRIGPLR